METAAMGIMGFPFMAPSPIMKATIHWPLTGSHFCCFECQDKRKNYEVRLWRKLKMKAASRSDAVIAAKNQRSTTERAKKLLYTGVKERSFVGGDWWWKKVWRLLLSHATRQTCWRMTEENINARNSRWNRDYYLFGDYTNDNTKLIRNTSNNRTIVLPHVHPLARPFPNHGTQFIREALLFSCFVCSFSLLHP